MRRGLCQPPHAQLTRGLARSVGSMQRSSRGPSNWSRAQTSQLSPCHLPSMRLYGRGRAQHPPPPPPPPPLLSLVSRLFLPTAAGLSQGAHHCLHARTRGSASPRGRASPAGGSSHFRPGAARHIRQSPRRLSSPRASARPTSSHSNPHATHPPTTLPSLARAATMRCRPAAIVCPAARVHGALQDPLGHRVYSTKTTCGRRAAAQCARPAHALSAVSPLALALAAAARPAQFRRVQPMKGTDDAARHAASRRVTAA